MGDGTDRVRLDKWLWAARFFKTRGLASEAVQGGRVHVNGQRVKSSREARVDDLVEISQTGSATMTVIVVALSARRGPAPEAQRLYRETDASARARDEHQALRRMAPPPGVDLGARPTKRDRRRLDDTRGRRG